MDVDKNQAAGKFKLHSDAIGRQAPEPGWLTQEQMAASCDMSRSGFQKWGVDPVAKIGRRTYYRTADVLTNRLDKLAGRLTTATGPQLDNAELTRIEREEKLRLTKAQAEGQEIKNAQLREELAPVALIEWVLGKVGGQISAILDALPSQLKKRNAKLTATNIETIRREIVKTQNIAARVTVDLDEYYERKQT